MTRNEATRPRTTPVRRVAVAMAAGTAVAVAAGAVLTLAALGPDTSASASARTTAAGSPAPARFTRGSVGWRCGPRIRGASQLGPRAYRNAQLSVPGSWLVESQQQLWCAFPRSGMIFAGVEPRLPKSIGCGLTASVAWIVPAGHIPRGIGHRRPSAVINGIRVYRLPSGKGSVVYLVPELGVRVGARGPSARRVLATLTRSPLSVVIGRGSGAVPARWTRRRFGGVFFAVPRSWSLQRADQWATCGTGLVPDTLLLIRATRPPLVLPCPFSIPTASADQAQPGLTVVSGKYAAESVGQSFLRRCRERRGVRICLSTVTGEGGFFSGVLIFSVSRPHHEGVTYFLLGLSGSATAARTVFDSVTADPR
jgi:hypothetical protein